MVDETAGSSDDDVVCLSATVVVAAATTAAFTTAVKAKNYTGFATSMDDVYSPKLELKPVPPPAEDALLPPIKFSGLPPNSNFPPPPPPKVKEEKKVNVGASTSSSSSAIKYEASAPLSPRTQIKAFNLDVANHVKRILNGYYKGIGGCAKKISNKEDYVSLAKHFSHAFRQDEKAGHLAAGKDIEDIAFTEQMKLSLQDKIDEHMLACPSPTN
jgi:hypothetical protein